jgi:hypothetical protein
MLTENERLLLMAAVVHELGPGADLTRANTARVVDQVLRWRGLSDQQVRAGWRDLDCDPMHREVYEALVRMTGHRYGDVLLRAPERPGLPLFEGAGNWGVPGDPSRPACWPQYNACRLTAEGEELARELLAQHPEYG